MTNIEKELISNKPSCYIFDIDGCLANVDHIILTYEQTYKIAFEKFLEQKAQYAKAYLEFEKQLKRYNKGEIDKRPVEPELPVEPIRMGVSKAHKIDWDYFHAHLLEAIPISGVVDLFTSIASSHKVILLTGRWDTSRVKTIEWLKRTIIEKGGDDLFRRINFQLIMREEKDQGIPCSKYKRAKILELSKNYNIKLCIEDRPEIIKELTDLGLLVLSPNKQSLKQDDSDE